MDKFEIERQKQIDEEILYYVRGMQTAAPIRVEGIHGYLVKTRRHQDLIRRDVELRLSYLLDKGLLKQSLEWEAGEGRVAYYQITAKGSDLIDGVIAPE